MAERKICSIPTCGNYTVGRGWCQSHYDRWRKHGYPLAGGPAKPKRKPKPKRICSISGCGKFAHGQHYCMAHYTRLRRYGDPLKGGLSPQTPSGTLMPWLMAHAAYDRDDCLTWPFSKSSKGRAQIQIKERMFNAARVMCEIAHGAPPTPKHEAAHSCGNGHQACVNPKHLRWATKIENEADKLMHGTLIRGEAMHTSKLTEANIVEIRRLGAHMKQRDIAKMFGVTQANIGYILRRKAWAWVK